MKNILTKRQVEILNKIQEYTFTYQVFPSLRAIGKIVGISSPNGVKKHLESLVQKGYLNYKDKKYSLKNTQSDYTEVRVLGYANAGQPLSFADENELGVLKIKSDNLKNKKELFAVIIQGDSMNKQKVNNKFLKDNQYAIVQKTQEFQDGDTVLALIDNSATIKNIKRKNEFIILYPNSSNPKHREIFIDLNENFIINGKVIDVLPLIVS